MPFKSKEKELEYRKQYYILNKEKLKNASKIAREIGTRNQRLSYAKQYYLDNKEKLKEKSKKYKQEHKEKINLSRKESMKIPKNLIHHNISNLINKTLKNNRGSKNNNSILKFLPCTIQELKTHIESLFEPWMNWCNWGKYNLSTWKDEDKTTWRWQLDHIIPHSIFNYSSMEDQSFRYCWSLKNLRPYSAKQNIIDGSRGIRHFKDNTILG